MGNVWKLPENMKHSDSDESYEVIDNEDLGVGVGSSKQIGDLGVYEQKISLVFKAPAKSGFLKVECHVKGDSFCGLDQVNQFSVKIVDGEKEQINLKDYESDNE